MKKIFTTAALLVALMLAGCGPGNLRPAAGSPEAKARYEERLKDPRWRELRLKILERDSWRCQICGTRTGLNVHHLYYVKGKQPWEYPPEALITLCKHCHGHVHGLN